MLRLSVPNGQHRLAMVATQIEGYKLTRNTTFVNSPNELLFTPSEYHEVSTKSTIYHGILSTFYAPEKWDWNEESLDHFVNYSKSVIVEGRYQQFLKLDTTIKNMLNYMGEKENQKLWNWDVNDFMGRVKLDPRDEYRKLFRELLLIAVTNDPGLEWMITYKKDQEKKNFTDEQQMKWRTTPEKYAPKFIEEMFYKQDKKDKQSFNALHPDNKDAKSTYTYGTKK